MSVEGVGEAVTGGMIARAVELSQLRRPSSTISEGAGPALRAKPSQRASGT